MAKKLANYTKDEQRLIGWMMKSLGKPFDQLDPGLIDLWIGQAYGFGDLSEADISFGGMAVPASSVALNEVADD